MSNVNIAITEHAQLQIKDAIKWRARSQGTETARDAIKAAITGWKSQLETFPESGKACKYYNSPEFRELIKGDYRFVYEIRQHGDQLNIYLLIFCHTKMDYETLLKQFNQF